MKRNFFIFFVLSWLVMPAQAYVDVSPSLGWIIKDATTITVLEVDKVSQERRIVVFKKVADLKGESADLVVRHHIGDGFHPREPRMVMDWAEPGQRAICFQNGKSALICTGTYWYECVATKDSWWNMTTGRPELSLAYYGPAEKLRAGIPDILKGKEVVLPAVNHGARFGVYQYENVAFHKVLRGRDCPVWRIKTSLAMPETIWRVSAKDSPWVVGPGAAAAEDVPALVKLLAHAEAPVRAHAAEDLGLIGWKAKTALADLTKACADADPLVRVNSARAIVLIGDEAQGPLAVLMKALKDTNPKIRKAAAIAIGDLESDAKSAVPDLRDLIDDEDKSVAWAAADALAMIGPDAKLAVPSLAMALRDKAIRVMAADALGGIGPNAGGAVPLLIDALKSKDHEFAWTSAIALTRIDPKSARVAMPFFIEKLESNDFRARWDAMQFIMPMGLHAKAAAPAVLAIVKRGNGVAAQALAAVAGPDAMEALPILLHVLEDDWDTSISISKIGAKAVPSLLATLKDPKGKSKHLVVKAIGLLAGQSEEAIPALIATLKNPDPVLRKAAATALDSLEPRAKDATAALVAQLEDPDPTVRLAVAKALRGLDSETAVSALQNLMTHARVDLRKDAALALGEFGVSALPAIKNLKEGLKDGEPSVRSACALAIVRVKGASSTGQAVAVLIDSLKDKNPEARLEAVRYLGNLGPEAREAIPALYEARLDESEDVRRTATESLNKILAK